MNQVTQRSQFRRVSNLDLDRCFGALDRHVRTVGEVEARHVAIELESGAFGGGLGSPAFVEPVARG